MFVENVESANKHFRQIRLAKLAFFQAHYSGKRNSPRTTSDRSDRLSYPTCTSWTFGEIREFKI